MPDGQLSFSSSISLHPAAVQADLKANGRVAWKGAGPSPIAPPLRIADVLARNRQLEAALDRQQRQCADLHGVLTVLDIAALCLGPDLKLRVFTGCASRMLGIGPGHLGGNVLLALPIDPSGRLIARVRVVLAGGLSEAQPLQRDVGPPLLCRVLPLHPSDASDAACDGVILTFAVADPMGGWPASPIAQAPEPSCMPEDGGLGAGYPQLGYGLTRRQHQVLGHVLAGHPSKNIAADLGISRRTVENHRAAIMARTGATSLPALARLAIGADVGGDCKPISAARLAR
jgi:DNA-binding CsgD family transcriptional regulator